MSSRNDARVPYPVLGGTQSVAYTATHGAITNPVGDQTRTVLVYASTDCHVQFAKTPVATTADMFIPALAQIFLRIHPGQKVSAIRNSADGTLIVSEMDY